MTDRSIEPAISKRGLWRSGTERLALDAWIAKMILSGYSQRNLCQLYEEEYGKRLPENTLSKTITKLKEEWKLAKADDTNYYINRELERFDVMEDIAWEHYYTCGGTIEATETKELFDADGNKKEELVSTKTKDDPRTAMQWFDKIMKIQTDRRKVLKLETVVSINNIMAIKGYTFFDPGNDWPSANENVIEAEVAGESE